MNILPAHGLQYKVYMHLCLLHMQAYMERIEGPCPTINAEQHFEQCFCTDTADAHGDAIATTGILEGSTVGSPPMLPRGGGMGG